MAKETHDLNFKATELRLGLPGSDECDDDMASAVKTNKRASPESVSSSISAAKSSDQHDTAPAPKAPIVGWPPVRSYRKNNLQQKKTDESGMFVKVSMDGAPYLRKIDLKVYNGYPELLKGLETMFKLTIGEYLEREGYKGSEYAPAYEDKDGDLMLVGDVPWDMFLSSCNRLRIIKGPDASNL